MNLYSKVDLTNRSLLKTDFKTPAWEHTIFIERLITTSSTLAIFLIVDGHHQTNYVISSSSCVKDSRYQENLQ